MTAPLVRFARRQAWRLAKALAPDLTAKATASGERTALDQLLGLTGVGLQVDWVEMAFNSRYGGRFKLPNAYGAFYAALTVHSAEQEAAYNWAKTFASTAARNPPGAQLVLQVLRLKLTGAFVDVRKGHPELHDPNSHAASQVFGFKAQTQGRDGIVYRSVRTRPRGSCVVVFRKTVVVSCVPAGQLVLTWDGSAFQ